MAGMAKKGDLIKPPSELVDAFFSWFWENKHSESEDLYSGIITYRNLSEMDRDSLIDFFHDFARKGGDIQSGGFRTAPQLLNTIKKDFDSFRAFILEPFSSDFDELDWLNRIKGFRSLGVGLATIYLNRIDKKRFAILNKKAANAVKLLNAHVPSEIRKQYLAVHDAWSKLIEWYPRFDNYFRTDALSQFLIGEDYGKEWKNYLENIINQNGTNSNEINFKFTKQTFSLLEQLHKNPTTKFYHEYNAQFNEHLENPFKQLLSEVAQWLDPVITEFMETGKRIFSKIPKNDYGRGYAWDFYWGAFYPKGGTRTEGAQLFVWINKDYLDFGFYIGKNGVEQRSRFIKACSQYSDMLQDLLKNNLSRKDLWFGDRSYQDYASSELIKTDLTWLDWLNQVEAAGIRAGVTLARDEVLKIPHKDLVGKIADVFKDLFPLVYLATSDEPLSYIRRYLGDIPEFQADLNPEYTLEQCSSDSYFDREQLNQWVQAIHRKKQAIFFGPPGTGKTFIAEKLARHIIGGGDGIFDIVQFHPSYAYEDFIQGLRPKAVSGGNLEYAMVPGRFINFCSQAQECRDTCVLIIDEINRANLSRVLGEMMYLLEYRDRYVPLASSGSYFQIPHNVRIIGTMNTADRSIALVDHALRRRFAFLGIYPNYEILRKFHLNTNFDPEGLIRVLERLNEAIYDSHYSVGVSYFLSLSIETDIEDIWRMEIEPYIEELFFDQPDKAAIFSWNKVKEEIKGQ